MRSGAPGRHACPHALPSSSACPHELRAVADPDPDSVGTGRPNMVNLTVFGPLRNAPKTGLNRIFQAGNLQKPSENARFIGFFTPARVVELSAAGA
jgi:hypothetical protein